MSAQVGFSRRSGACLRFCLLLSVAALAIYIYGPALYLRFKKAISLSSDVASCEPCICDCPPPLSLADISPGLINLSIADCGENDPDLNREMKKQFVDLLTEELKLQEAVAEENLHHLNLTFIEAKRLASQYQREAEKCNTATETCEAARERAEASLTKEKKVTSLWEKKARQLGWEGEYA